MIVRTDLIAKSAATSSADFLDQLRAQAESVGRLPGLRRYHQNLVLDREQRGIDYPRGAHDFDAIAQLWFDDIASMNAAFASDEGAQATKGAPGDQTATVLAVQHVVIHPTDRTPLIKRMSTLTRRADVGAETFLHEWFDVHSTLVKRLPQVRGYAQSLVIDRRLGESAASYEALPIDGLVELWFEDLDRLTAGFGSDAGRTLMCHATEFISEISTFLVEPHQII